MKPQATKGSQKRRRAPGHSSRLGFSGQDHLRRDEATTGSTGKGPGDAQPEPLRLGDVLSSHPPVQRRNPRNRTM